MQVLSSANTTTGYGANDATSVMTVAQGEAFVVETNDRFATMPSGGQPDPSTVGALVGPVHVQGVVAGDCLAINVRAIKSLTGIGYLLVSSRYGILGERVTPRARAVAIREDSIALTEDADIPYQPMIGKMGVAPAAPAAGTASGSFGGALGCTEIAPGTTLLVQAERDGGQLCLEDVHGAMGDGEATASAVEMAAAVELSCRRYDGPPLPMPSLLTPSELVVLARGNSLDEAAHNATELLLSVLMQRRAVDLSEAALLVGAAADVRISFMGARPIQARAAIARNLVGL